MFRFVGVGLCGLLALVLVAGGGYGAAEKDKAEKKLKYTIKKVMKLAHKDGLLKKVIDGKASAEDKEKLAKLYVALSQNEPPAGDAEEWKQTTRKMVAAARAAAKGDDNAPELLQAAVNCKICHGKFKNKS
jgi:hypothetical protein